jgi:hypothetical protein
MADIRKEVKIPNLMKIRTVGAELFYSDKQRKNGWMDRHK